MLENPAHQSILKNRLYNFRRPQIIPMSRKRADPDCPHLDLVDPVEPAGDVCDRCVAMGDTWVHLRACLSCGRVGCCDLSKNKHATKH